MTRFLRRFRDYYAYFRLAEYPNTRRYSARMAFRFARLPTKGITDATE